MKLITLSQEKNENEFENYFITNKEYYFIASPE